MSTLNGADTLQRFRVPWVWVKCAGLHRLPALLVEPAVAPLKLHRQHVRSIDGEPAPGHLPMQMEFCG